MVRRIDLGRKEGEKGDGKEDGREARQREREKAIDSKLKSSQTSSSSSLSPSLIVRRREMHEHTKEPQHNFPRDRCVCVGRDDTMAGAHYRQPRPFASLGGGLWLLVLLSFFLFFLFIRAHSFISLSQRTELLSLPSSDPDAASIAFSRHRVQVQSQSCEPDWLIVSGIRCCVEIPVLCRTGGAEVTGGKPNERSPSTQIWGGQSCRHRQMKRCRSFSSLASIRPSRVIFHPDIHIEKER